MGYLFSRSCCLHVQVEKEKQVSQGDLEIRPGSDLLVEVLGPEHPGRMRAIGYNVGLKQSILGIKEKNRKKHEILDLKEMKAKQEEHAKSIADMEDKIASLRREIAKNNDDTVTSPSPVVNKTSLESTPVVDALDKISVCIVYLYNINNYLYKGTSYIYTT